MKIGLPKIFRYCPGCGASGPKAHSKGKHITCSRCGFDYYHNVASAAGAIIEYGSKILIAIRANEPKAGMFDFPGGFADYGESVEETLAREVREELGIKIKNPRYLTSAPNIYVYKGITYATTDLVFTYRIDEPKKIKLNKKEIAEVKFFEPEKIPLNKMAFSSIKKALKYYIKLRHQRG
ncbi:MAG: NUDIX domain-containing protein [Sedimentisphaerales bacterium]|jgi:NADH pyrophosphatase NudC (nudix superfamily)